NGARASLTVEWLGAEEVTVNLQPGEFPNQVKLGTREATISILTTSAGEYGHPEAFDAANVIVGSVTIGTRRMVQGLEPGTRRYGDASLGDSLETIVPETVQDQDEDLNFSYFDVSDSGLRATDNEVCVKGLYKEPATGQEREFFGCDAAVVIQ